MNDIMLFGEGWGGEVRKIEPHLWQFNFIPTPAAPHLREVMFTVLEYVSDDGDIYKVGYTGKEPFAEDIREAIFRYRPNPV
ncbi:hypothetical protein ACUTSW_05415 [Serratia sp. TSA_198.1]|uniref:hypothetical protein n=1 Tax=Serratia sp. TSA_198.1 TaxID=3415664 RepID=UPI0040459B0C